MKMDLSQNEGTTFSTRENDDASWGFMDFVFRISISPKMPKKAGTSEKNGVLSISISALSHKTLAFDVISMLPVSCAVPLETFLGNIGKLIIPTFLKCMPYNFPSTKMLRQTMVNFLPYQEHTTTT